MIGLADDPHVALRDDTEVQPPQWVFVGVVSPVDSLCAPRSHHPTPDPYTPCQLAVAAQGGEVRVLDIPSLRVLYTDNSQPSPHGIYFPILNTG